jgi:hypothetical protein
MNEGGGNGMPMPGSGIDVRQGPSETSRADVRDLGGRNFGGPSLDTRKGFPRSLGGKRYASFPIGFPLEKLDMARRPAAPIAGLSTDGTTRHRKGGNR